MAEDHDHKTDAAPSEGHGHGHGGGGGHHHHHHGHGHHHHDANANRIGGAALLTGGFMVIEAAGGLFAGSLALLADAGHMLTDFASLALAWFAFRIARRPADWKRTYGFDRFAVLAAFVNGISLFVIAGLILFEAVQRLYSPTEVLAGPMMVIAVIGLAVNAGSFLVLHGGDRNNLNMRGALIHVMGDMLGSVAAIVAAGIIWATGWTPADPLLSVLVAMVILRGAWYVVRDSGGVLLEAAPPGLDTRAVAEDLATLPGVAAVHHLHAWSITEDRPMMTLHARLRDGADPDAARDAIRTRLAERHGVSHATVEIETAANGSAGKAPAGTTA